MQRIVICDPSDSSREHLRGLLLGMDFAFLDAECKRYEAFIDIIADNPPDLAILHLDGDPAKANYLISQLAANFAQVPLLVISKSHSAILEGLQNGAKHFLTEPVSLEDLLRVIRKALSEPNATTGAPGSGNTLRVAGTNAQVYALLGSRGGIGSTSLAVNLAAAIAADPDSQVALIDLDLALGDAGLHLSVTPNYTMADLAANIDKLDLNFLKRSLYRHESTNVSFLDRPSVITDIDSIEGAHVDRVLNLLKLSYTHLVVDLSCRFTPVDAAALAAADSILVVAQLELTSVLNASRIISSIGPVLDHSGDKIKVVLNKAGIEEADSEEHRISPRKAEEIIGRPFCWTVPYDPRAVCAARNEGVPLIKYAPKSRAHQALVGLAASLTKKQVTAAPAQASGLLRGLFKK
jgi:pilus assembly protein CpaE